MRAWFRHLQLLRFHPQFCYPVLVVKFSFQQTSIKIQNQTAKSPKSIVSNAGIFLQHVINIIIEFNVVLFAVGNK